MAAAGDEKEKVEKMVALLRASLESKHPLAKEADDSTLARFLRAREDLDVGKAASMYLKYLQWRSVAVPKGFISREEIKNQLAHGKVFMQGADKAGRPIVVGLAGRHYPSAKHMDELKRFAVFALDKICDKLRGEQEKFICIADVKGWGLANCDISGAIACLDILQNYYPERLGRLYMVHVPSIFMHAWNIVYPFMDKRTRETIRFVDNKKLKEVLLEDIDVAMLPEIYGGMMPLVPIEES